MWASVKPPLASPPKEPKEGRGEGRKAVTAAATAAAQPGSGAPDNSIDNTVLEDSILQSLDKIMHFIPPPPGPPPQGGGGKEEGGTEKAGGRGGGSKCEEVSEHGGTALMRRAGGVRSGRIVFNEDGESTGTVMFDNSSSSTHTPHSRSPSRRRPSPMRVQSLSVDSSLSGLSDAHSESAGSEYGADLLPRLSPRLSPRPSPHLPPRLPPGDDGAIGAEGEEVEGGEGLSAGGMYSGGEDNDGSIASWCSHNSHNSASRSPESQTTLGGSDVESGLEESGTESVTASLGEGVDGVDEMDEERKGDDREGMPMVNDADLNLSIVEVSVEVSVDVYQTPTSPYTVVDGHEQQETMEAGGEGGGEKGEAAAAEAATTSQLYKFR